MATDAGVTCGLLIVYSQQPLDCLSFNESMRGSQATSDSISVQN